jgi:hypothetical protein
MIIIMIRTMIIIIINGDLRKLVNENQILNKLKSFD